MWLFLRGVVIACVVLLWLLIGSQQHKGSIDVRRPETLAAVILSQVVLTSFNGGFHGFGSRCPLNVLLSLRLNYLQVCI